MDRSLIEQRNGVDAAAIAARHAEINGKPQRIDSLRPDQVNEDAMALINRIRDAAGAPPVTGAHLPGYFLTMLKHPELLRCHLEMGAAVYKGALPGRERELAILRVGWLMRAPYEWGEHVDIGKRNGLTAAEVARVIDGPEAPGWSEHDRTILRAVDELVSNQMISDASWAALAKTWDEKQMIEFPMMVGQYVATAFVQNSLRIRLAGDNPGLTHR
jgi:alkylhydroperoxidase family enzyme